MESSEEYFEHNLFCHQVASIRHKLLFKRHNPNFCRTLTRYPFQSTIMKTRRVVIHIFIWSFYITIECLALINAGMGSQSLYALLYYPLYISIFYLHAHVVLQFIKPSKHNVYFRLVSIVIFEILIAISICICIKILICVFLLGQSYNGISKFDISASAWRVLFFLMLSTGYGFANRSIRLVKQNSRLKLSQLQSQLKPHLLVNTLDFVYSTIVEISKEGSNVILLLSDVMRYSFKEAEADGKVPVTDEINQVRNLIAINQIRFGKRLILDHYISENWLDAWRIPPSLLLTLIGNVFQHGQLTNPEHPARIIIRSDDNQLSLFTYNLKRENAQRGSQTGLKNAQMQLKLFFPGHQHQISIKESELHYSLSLIIWL